MDDSQHAVTEKWLRINGFHREFDGRPQVGRHWVLSVPCVAPMIRVTLCDDGNVLSVAEQPQESWALIKLDATPGDVATLVGLMGGALAEAFHAK